MSETLTCSRCHQDKAPLAKAPFPGPVGAEVLARTCADCWREWEAMEVMVINELRLNFMDPEAQDVLTRHMREFLELG
ncbi:MAG: Fe(2+)-trafficking protein [Acidobacteria bacterium]|nr:Fe(2+)-trafficking protein [Acidobacteriota bacterium]